MTMNNEGAVAVVASLLREFSFFQEVPPRPGTPPAVAQKYRFVRGTLPQLDPASIAIEVQVGADIEPCCKVRAVWPHARDDVQPGMCEQLLYESRTEDAKDPLLVFENAVRAVRIFDKRTLNGAPRLDVVLPQRLPAIRNVLLPLSDRNECSVCRQVQAKGALGFCAPCRCVGLCAACSTKYVEALQEPPPEVPVCPLCYGVLDKAVHYFCQ